MPVYIISYNPIILIYSLTIYMNPGFAQDNPGIVPIYALRTSNPRIAWPHPWFVPQTMDPGFAQDNPGFAQIHALRVTYRQS